MRKLDLLIIVLLSGLTVFGQRAVHIDDIRSIPIDLSDHHYLKHAPSPTPALRSGAGPISVVPIGTSYNIYSILLDEQNQVMYNEDINSVVFVHRHNNGTDGGSGGLAFDISTDGGANWTDNLALSPDFNTGSVSDVTGNRYPSITLYNPSGNTDPANAFAVAAGPALSAAGGSWGYQFRHSARTDGSDICEDYYQSPGRFDFHPYGLTVNPNGDMWTISTEWDNTVSTTVDTVYYINKGVFNTSTNCVDWSVQYTINPDWIVDVASETVSGAGWNIAFSPDGMTGFAIVIGAIQGATTPTYAPNVWKTTDGGDNWSKLPDFDFTGLSVITDFLIPTSSGDFIPFFSSIDATVDQDGRLHCFTEMLPRSSSSIDSAGFVWIGQFLTGLFDVHTTDGTDWDAFLIDTIRVEDGAVGTVGHGPRVNVSRTADGSKVFYHWCSSDELLLATNDLPNSYTRAWDATSGDITFIKENTTGTGIDGVVFFPAISPVMIENGDDFEYEYAVVCAEPGVDDLQPPQYYYLKGIGFNEADFGVLAPPPVAGFTWVYDGFSGEVSFTNTSTNADSYIWDYDDLGMSNTALTVHTHTYAANGNYDVSLTAINAGGEDVFTDQVVVTNTAIEDIILDNALQVYPSLSSGIVNVVVNSNSFKEADIRVYNITGELVYENIGINIMSSKTTRLDLSNMADGNYFLHIRADGASVSRQITLAR